VIQVWWGRHAPESEQVKDEDIRGREQAKDRLSLLRNSKHYQFYPPYSNEPMENHAKLIIIDDSRLFITSDNVLAYGDPEFYQGDSGELGLIIDHPRIARYHRGQMELWLPEARDNNDVTRWGSAIADEIYYQSYSPHTSVSLEEAIKEFLMRILEISSIREDWNFQFRNHSHQMIIQQIVDDSWNNGGIIGLFHASGSGAGNYKSITVEQTLVSLSGDPIWREYTKGEEDFMNLMKKHQVQTLMERVKKYPITPQEFSEVLFTEMKKPYDWHSFTSVYSRVIQKNYLYNLKFRNIKPVLFLDLCTAFIDVDIRKGHPWIKKRRV